MFFLKQAFGRPEANIGDKNLHFLRGLPEMYEPMLYDAFCFGGLFVENGYKESKPDESDT